MTRTLAPVPVLVAHRLRFRLGDEFFLGDVVSFFTTTFFSSFEALYSWNYELHYEQDAHSVLLIVYYELHSLHS